MSRRILALFAKAPVPGQVKTRLTPRLTPERAAALYSAMLFDIVALHADETRVDLALWFSPAEAEPWFRQHMPPRFRRIPQSGPDLGSRMAKLFRDHAAEGYDRIVLRGTDNPTLPPSRIEEAFRYLDEADLVIGPDLDGGYGLIGLRAPCDFLFDLAMSHASVLDATLARATEAGLACRVLPAHHDVDTIEDLERLERDENLAPRTSAWLEGSG